MPKPKLSEITPNTILERLRTLIVDGKLAAGTKIHEAELSEKFGVSL